MSNILDYWFTDLHLYYFFKTRGGYFIDLQVKRFLQSLFDLRYRKIQIQIKTFIQNKI